MINDQLVPFKAVLFVFLLLALASVISHQSGLDRLIAHLIYSIEGGTDHGFPWSKNYWLYTVLHEGGRGLVKRLWFFNLLLLVCSFFINSLSSFRRVFLYIALATLISTSLISSLKHLTTIPCPKALQEFGGDRKWIDIWQVFAANIRRGSCYPAGHASGGYAWICLAFLFPFKSRNFYMALLPGALMGLVFGIAQQLRGAHFLSHDLLTIAVCWLTSGLLLTLMQMPWRASTQDSAAYSSPTS